MRLRLIHFSFLALAACEGRVLVEAGSNGAAPETGDAPSQAEDTGISGQGGETGDTATEGDSDTSGSGDTEGEPSGTSWGLAPTAVAEAGVTCGAETCEAGASCCFGMTGEACSAPGDAGQCMWAEVTCDDVGDCGAGTVCCATKDPAVFDGDAACVTEAECADRGGAPACTVDADCGEGGYCAAGFTNGAVLDLGLCQSVPPTACAAVPGADCDGDDLHGVDLFGRDLTGASFVGASFAGAQLSGALFDATDLTDANLDGALLSGCSMAGAQAAGASFVGTPLQLASGDGLVLVNANLERATIFTSLRGADLTGARLVDAGAHGNSSTRLDLTGALFVDADLTDAFFLHVSLEGGSLEGAVLDGVGFFDVVCPDGALSDDVGGTCEGHRTP